MKGTILVVDDDSMILFIHQVVIEGSILTAKAKYFLSAGTALEYIANEPDQDMRFLIFLDINMPFVNGWQMLNKLRNHPKREKILVAVVSSSVNQRDIDKAFSYEMVIDYITKPLKDECFERLKNNEGLAVFFE
ncbi:CheY-like chemotaxis protein [Pedobacter sp. UYP30]|uniref:response regulator n=1 Tax=Pedobacter sp. UYP30 TaxID=1756400 RepID=UPI003392A14D